MIERIDHLAIVVTDLNKTKCFFELLGFEETIRSGLDAAFLQAVTGIEGAAGSFVGMKHPCSDFVVELLKFDSPMTKVDSGIPMANAIGMRHLAFAVDDIDEMVAKLKGFGVDFISPVQTWEKTGKRLIYFYGPDGILMELAQYPKE